MIKTPDIILTPVTTSQFLLYNSRFKFFGIESAISNYVGFFDTSSILSKMKVETQPLFQCFRCFDQIIWSFFVISIIFLSLLSSLKNFNIIMFGKNVWNYSINLIGKSNTKINNAPSKLSMNLVGVWLLSAFMINILFNAFFLEEMVSPTPLTKINSMDDLFKSNMDILAREDSALYTYLDSIQSPLINRIESYKDLDPIKNKLFDGLRTGSLAYVNQRFTLINVIREMNNLEKQRKRGYEDNELLLHISNDDGGTEPYYLIINGNMDDDIENDINTM